MLQLVGECDRTQQQQVDDVVGQGDQFGRGVVDGGARVVVRDGPLLWLAAGVEEAAPKGRVPSTLLFVVG